MLAGHLLKHWSSTQKTTALSTGEAELGGILRGSSEVLGMKSLAADLGIELEANVLTDASAAVGICRRTGIGKVRHLAVGQLWVQERLRSGDFRLHKHPGECNPGDMLTKHVPRELVQRHTAAMGLSFPAGRAECAPSLTQAQGGTRETGSRTRPGASSVRQ